VRRCSYTSEMHIFTLRMPQDTWDRLCVVAYTGNASVNRIIVDFIEAGVAEPPSKRAKPEDELPWLTQ